MISKIIDGAQQLGVTLSEEAALKLLRVLDALDEWNQRMNLTAIRDREAQVTKHLLDSLSIARFLHGDRIIDIGTGAGFPGLPLAIAFPDRHFTLLDSTAKKLKFIDHVCEMLSLKNVETVHSRAEAYKPKERYDIVISRAVGPVKTFIRWTGHLCAGGGRLLAMKGRYPTDELAALPSGWKLATVHRLAVPGLDEQRNLVEICHSHEKLEQ